MVGAARSQLNVSNNAAWLAVSPEIGPQFPEHGAGNRAPISGKTPPPEIGAQFGPLVGGIEQACAPPLGQIQVASTAIHLHLLHGHRPRSRPDQTQNPNSKRPVWILDFGFWISDFGFWISLVFVLFVAAPNGPVWILDFGFWILGLSTPFGSCIRYFLVTPTRVGGYYLLLLLCLFFSYDQISSNETLAAQFMVYPVISTGTAARGYGDSSVK